MRETDWLILIPTKKEAELFECGPFEGTTLEICGFGPVAAAASTSRLIARYQPRRVMLAGIAGSFSSALSVGSAHQFREVGCYGVGVGTGRDFRSAEQLGWWQFDQHCRIGDRLELAACASDERQSGPKLLSVCSASANHNEAQMRARDFDAEDMEGFACAAACTMASTPCFIIRGISNMVGDRDHMNWQFRESMQAVSQLAGSIIKGTP